MKKNIRLFLILFVLIILSGLIFFALKYFSRSNYQTIDLNNTEKVNDSVGNENPENLTEQKENEVVESNSIQPEEKAVKNKTEPVKNEEMKAISLKITNKLVSWGFAKGSDNHFIDTLIIHSSYDALNGDPYDVTGLIKEYKSYGVSPHYLIDRKGQVYRLVEEKNIAYHAGEGKTPDGRANVNSFSLGIEMMTTKTDKLTDEQYAALNKLIQDIKGRYKIKYILGHNQIAPGRKDDPWNFDWGKINK